MALIDHARLLQVLKYDPETGIFTWLEKISIKVVVGRAAGGTNVGGYTVISLFGQFYYAHRLAWFYMTGEWPKQIDHADGDRSNNRFANLRRATHIQNILNAKMAKNNTSGFKGVSWHKGAGKWMVQTYIDGVKIYLGLYEDPAEGYRAYERAVNNTHPEFLRAK